MEKTHPQKLLLWLVLFFTTFHFSCDNEQTITILPLGKVDAKIIEIIKHEIQDTYSANVIVLPKRKIPRFTYPGANHRYDATKILKFLKKKYPSQSGKILAVTSYDIYHKKGKYKHYGIIGLGQINDIAAIVSTYRIKKAGGDKKSLFIERLKKVTIHEIGHLYGLHHCTRADYCVMGSAKGSVLTIDKKELRFCPYCKGKIKKYLKKSRH